MRNTKNISRRDWGRVSGLVGGRLRECVGDRTEEIHEANLFDMGSKNADVIPLQEVLSFVRSMEPVNQV